MLNPEKTEVSESNNISRWKWEYLIAGGLAGVSNLAITHPFDVVRTRFQVHDGRISYLPKYKHTLNALYTIARSEGLRGLYAGFSPALFGGAFAWGSYIFVYNKRKEKRLRNSNGNSSYYRSSTVHLLSATEAGALVCLLSNPMFLVKTRLQLQTPHSDLRRYYGFFDALTTIIREEGWRALYRGIVPSLIMVGNGAIQFTAYDLLCKSTLERKKRNKSTTTNLNSWDFAAIGASSKVVSFIFTYPMTVIRSRLQQCPSVDGVPQYANSLGVVKETVRFEGIRGFYKGVTPHLLKNLPSSALFFVVYENVMKYFANGRRS